MGILHAVIYDALPIIVAFAVIVLVHEFGHFITAKLFGMRVDEFGLGFPPRLFSFGTYGGTEYTINALPVGGFVRIYGENPTATHEVAPGSFSSRPRIQQAIVLLAGVTMNLILAYVLIVWALMAGFPVGLTSVQAAQTQNVHMAITGVLPNSPASAAGLVQGDVITHATDAQGSWSGGTITSFSTFVQQSAGTPITLDVTHLYKKETLTVSAAQHLVPGAPARYVLGVDIAAIGIQPESFGQALGNGFTVGKAVVVETAKGVYSLFYHPSLKKVSGPVGISKDLIGASQQGFGSFLWLMAVISISLALLNVLPIPALDGGRLLFVIIEGVTRRRISPQIVVGLINVSMLILLALIAVVTIHDIVPGAL